MSMPVVVVAVEDTAERLRYRRALVTGNQGLVETKEARRAAAVDRKTKLDDVAAVEIHKARDGLRILISSSESGVRGVGVSLRLASCDSQIGETLTPRTTTDA
jgi:hypothetical protein